VGIIVVVMEYKFTLLIDAQAFWENLKRDIVASRRNVFIQTLSFEGDVVGWKLAKLLLSCHSAEVRVLVDSFNKWVLSDKFLYWPKNLLNPQLRHERRETSRMLGDLVSRGVQLKFTNPVNTTSLISRNHKKIVTIDGHITYIGGINFSEHNFAWHDMMLRIASPSVAQVVEQDFLSTWCGRDAALAVRGEDIELYTLDGHSNPSVFGPVLRCIEQAKRCVFVESPYLTVPFFDSLRVARERGVEVVAVTPLRNNRRILRDYIVWQAKKYDIEVRLYHRMTHLKALLIDDEILVLGSSNFDLLSYLFHQEVIAIVRDRQVIADFRERVIKRDLENAHEPNGNRSALQGRALYLLLRSLGWLCTAK
jgi:cardiolipin synthase